MEYSTTQGFLPVHLVKGIYYGWRPPTHHFCPKMAKNRPHCSCSNQTTTTLKQERTLLVKKNTPPHPTPPPNMYLNKCHKQFMRTKRGGGVKWGVYYFWVCRITDWDPEIVGGLIFSMYGIGLPMIRFFWDPVPRIQNRQGSGSWLYNKMALGG